MYDSTRTVAVLLATLTVVGFGIAPMAAVAAPSESSDTAYQTDGNDVSTQADEHGPFPEEICTDLLGAAHEEMPYDMIVWINDLPEDAQPPGVPWDVITPQAVAGIVVGATPNHCEVQDPNDPTYDPIQNDDDEVDPDGNADAQQGEDGRVLFIVNGTLDNTSEGPSVEGSLGLNLSDNGSADPEGYVNDGEKDYGVSPELQYWSDGTTYFETDVFVFGSRLGVVQDCTGPECTFSTRGLPNYVAFPALPSHSDEDYDTSDDSGGDSSGGDSGGADDGADSTDDGTGGTGSDGGSTDDADGASGAGSGGDSGGADGADSTDGGEGGADGTGGDGETSADGADSSGDGDDGQSGDGGDGGDGGESTDDAENQKQSGQDGDQQAQRAAAADGSGLGVVVAMVVFILGAAAIAPRD